MIINNLPEKAIAEAGLSIDRRFKHWAKWVDSVDQSKTDGYAFVGEFIKTGTIELTVDKPRLILCASVTGSRANNNTDYAVLVFDPDGTLSTTDIKADDNTKGWALRIRDKVHDLLVKLNSTESSTQKVTFELTLPSDLATKIASVDQAIVTETLIKALSLLVE